MWKEKQLLKLSGYSKWIFVVVVAIVFLCVCVYYLGGGGGMGREDEVGEGSGYGGCLLVFYCINQRGQLCLSNKTLHNIFQLPYGCSHDVSCSAANPVMPGCFHDIIQREIRYFSHGHCLYRNKYNLLCALLPC